MLSVRRLLRPAHRYAHAGGVLVRATLTLIALGVVGMPASPGGRFARR